MAAPNLDFLLRVSNHLGVSLDWLLRGREPTSILPPEDYSLRIAVAMTRDMAECPLSHTAHAEAL